MTAAPVVVPDVADEPTVIEGFGDDPLGRVQGLLFGDHAQRTNDRLDSIEQTLSELIAELRASVETQLSELADQLKHEAQTRDDAVSELSRRVDQEVKTLSKADTALGRKLDKTRDDLRSRITDAAAAAYRRLASRDRQRDRRAPGPQRRTSGAGLDAAGGRQRSRTELTLGRLRPVLAQTSANASGTTSMNSSTSSSVIMAESATKPRRARYQPWSKSSWKNSSSSPSGA